MACSLAQASTAVTTTHPCVTAPHTLISLPIRFLLLVEFLRNTFLTACDSDCDDVSALGAAKGGTVCDNTIRPSAGHAHGFLAITQ